MNKRFSLSVVVMCLVIGGWILAHEVLSQQPAPRFTPAANPAPVPVPPSGLVEHTDPTTGVTVFTTGAGMPARSEIDRLMATLKTVDDDDEKKAGIKKQLEDAVAKYFDEDLKNREAELVKIEERLKKLTAQLEKRRKAKAEIISLQLKVLLNEAEGLGFGSGVNLDPAVRSVYQGRQFWTQQVPQETAPGRTPRLGQ